MTQTQGPKSLEVVDRKGKAHRFSYQGEYYDAQIGQVRDALKEFGDYLDIMEKGSATEPPLTIRFIHPDHLQAALESEGIASDHLQKDSGVASFYADARNQLWIFTAHRTAQEDESTALHEYDVTSYVCHELGHAMDDILNLKTIGELDGLFSMAIQDTLTRHALETFARNGLDAKALKQYRDLRAKLHHYFVKNDFSKLSEQEQAQGARVFEQYQPFLRKADEVYGKQRGQSLLEVLEDSGKQVFAAELLAYNVQNYLDPESRDLLKKADPLLYLGIDLLLHYQTRGLSVDQAKQAFIAVLRKKAPGLDLQNQNIQVHVIQPGQSLYQILQEYGYSYNDIVQKGGLAKQVAQLNGLSNINAIAAGDILLIPQKN